MKKILCVGCGGYIGGAVTDILIEETLTQNLEFTVYDKLLYERDYRKPVNFIYGDINDYNHLKKVINTYKPDSIIWLAAIVGDGACQVNPELTIQTNSKSVKWLSENYNGRIVFTSTCSVYGHGDVLLTEKSKQNPLSLYATSKQDAEKFLNSKNAVIFRLGTIFGVSDTYSRIRTDLVTNILSVKAALNEKLTVFGGDQYRPLLHVKDAAKAIVNAAIIDEHEIGIFNLVYKNMNMKELGEMIKNIAKKDFNLNTEIEYSDILVEDKRNYKADGSKYKLIKNNINFTYTLEDGIKEIIKLVLENRIKNPYNINYSNEKYLKENETEIL